MNEPYEMSEALHYIRTSIDLLDMPISEYVNKINTKEVKKGSEFRLNPDSAWQYRTGAVQALLEFALPCMEQLCKQYNFIERDNKDED